MVDLNSVLDKFAQTTGKIEPSSDNRIDRVDSLKVIWYQWILDNPSPQVPNLGESISFDDLIPDDFLTESRSFDLSNHVISFTYTKTMEGASGTWELLLGDSVEWDKYLRPGTWLCTFLSNNDPTNFAPKETAKQGTPIGNVVSDFIGGGSSFNLPVTSAPPIPERSSTHNSLNLLKEKCRMMGVITRTGIVNTVDENGTEITQYKVSGKDFGIVFEEFNLWFNAHLQESTVFQTTLDKLLQNEQSLSKWMKTWFTMFFDPTKFKLFSSDGTNEQAVNDAAKITEIHRQWLIPKGLAKDFGLVETDFSGNLHLGQFKEITEEFNTSPFGIADKAHFNPDITNAWSKLKELSQPEFHELFTELGPDGTPRVFFRPIPFSRKKNTVLYPTLASQIKTFDDLASEFPLLKFDFDNFGDGPLDVLLDAIEGFLKNTESKKRLIHRVDVNPLEIEMFDIGPGFHDRYNQFMVNLHNIKDNLSSSLVLFGKDASLPFPLRDSVSVKRNGFKPLHIDVNMYRTSFLTNFSSNILAGGGLTEKSPKEITPDLLFLAELNHLMADYHTGTKDHYSGSMIIFGKNQIKLGKTLVVDQSAKKIGNYVFYIEGYTDHFEVDENGTGVWTQTLQLTRGQPLSNFLVPGNIQQFLNDLQQNITQPQTFHVDPENI